MRQALVLSAREARRFMLSHLLLAGGKGEGAEGVMKAFERLNCVQFDPLSVAGRSHDIALQARVKDYRPALCEELLYWHRQLGKPESGARGFGGYALMGRACYRA